MKTVYKLLAGLSALAAPAALQAQTVQVNYVAPIPVPGNNNFITELSGLGLTQYTTMGASLLLSSDATIYFEFLGSESGFSDTFTAGSATLTETSGFENHFAAPIPIGFASFLAGSLTGLLNFTSVGGTSATVGQDGFGIFLGPNQTSGQNVSVFYLGFDDQVTNVDDNHDDFIVRATVLPAVPEPATWAMMLIGFAGVGYSMRRRRRADWIRQAA
ncbi:MAG: PEPxxWA-CTERM sorting domain-containing protein [Pseudomonadota bacterium]